MLGDVVKLTDETSIITDIAISSGSSGQKGMDLPPLIFAQSGAIYFEEQIVKIKLFEVLK